MGEVVGVRGGVSQGTQVSRSVHVNQRGVRVLSFSSSPPPFSPHHHWRPRAASRDVMMIVIVIVMIMMMGGGGLSQPGLLAVPLRVL